MGYAARPRQPDYRGRNRVADGLVQPGIDRPENFGRLDSSLVTSWVCHRYIDETFSLSENIAKDKLCVEIRDILRPT